MSIIKDFLIYRREIKDIERTVKKSENEICNKYHTFELKHRATIKKLINRYQISHYQIMEYLSRQLYHKAAMGFIPNLEYELINLISRLKRSLEDGSEGIFDIFGWNYSVDYEYYYSNLTRKYFVLIGIFLFICLLGTAIVMFFLWWMPYDAMN
jgi:hypothetical protein